MTLSNSFSDPNRPQPFHARKHSHCKLKTAALTFILLRHLSVRSRTYFCSQFRFLFTFLQRILCSFDTFSPRHVFLSSPPKSTFCVKPRRFDLASNRSAGIDILFRGLRLTSIHFFFFYSAQEVWIMHGKACVSKGNLAREKTGQIGGMN